MNGESVEKVEEQNLDSESQASEETQTVQEVDFQSLFAPLEALVFAAGEPLDIDKIGEILALTPENTAKLIDLFSARLDSEERGVMLAKVKGGVVLRTRPDHAEYVSQLKAPIQRRLTAQALETLAVIAYRQPVVKSDIDTIRGVDVGPTLKTLIERDLVQVVGHESTIGNPALYGTTETFLSVFGLNSLKDLPKIEALNNFQEQDKRAAA